jgi:hypothetical protein
MSDSGEEIAETVNGVTKSATGGLLGILPGVLGLSLTMKGIEYMTKEDEKKE